MRAAPTSLPARRGRALRLGEGDPTTKHDLVELATTADAMAKEGSRPAKGWARCIQEAQRFNAWHEELFETTVEERWERYAARGPGRPEFPTWLWLGWVANLLEETMGKPRTVRRYLLNLRNWLRGTGWEIDQIEEIANLVNNAIDNWWVEQGDQPDIRRPGRPVLAGEGLEAITDAIDAYFADPKVSDAWVVNIRTFHLLAWASGARIGELVVKARWSWLRFVGDQLHVEFPAGLKHQKQALTIVIDPHPHDSRYCAVAAVRQLRAEAEKAGISTGPSNPVFGWARKTQRGDRKPRYSADRSTWSAKELRARTDWRADPVEECLADPTWLAGKEEAVRRYTSETHHAKRFREAWRQAAAEAGFESRHALERIVPHGIRRGRATSMKMAGASTAQVAAALRHQGVSVTADYIDIRSLDPLDVTSLIEEVPNPRPKTEPNDQVSAFETTLKRASEGAEDPKDYQASTCQIPMDEGGECGRETVQVLIEWGRVCMLHDRRHRKGQPMGAPIAKRAGRQPRCEVLMDSGEVCGRKTAKWRLEGHGAACEQHNKRHERGEPMGVPFRRHSPRGQLCQVVMDNGELCGNGGKMFSDAVFEWICTSHQERRRRGTPLGQPWKRFSPEGQRCEVLMEDGSVCGRTGEMNRVEGHGWVCSSHARRWKQGQPMGRAWARRAPEGQACEVQLDIGGACGRDGPMIWVDGYGWTCGGHYHRAVKDKPMGAPIGSAPRKRRVTK